MIYQIKIMAVKINLITYTKHFLIYIIKPKNLSENPKREREFCEVLQNVGIESFSRLNYSLSCMLKGVLCK